MPLSAGQTLSWYEILGALGAGAMGEVYRARDTRLEREVAIKVLPADLAEDEERLRRFEREARTLASLNHSNVAQVYGLDRVGETAFIVMELVPGEDLAARLSRGALALSEALDVCRQIAEGVEAAHEAGVIHRDLKPANVVTTPEGRVKVLDFGLAKPAGGGPRERAKTDSVLTTQEGRLLGTPAYMAPEQARGRPVDQRVDVWAFGCVLYECLTGRQVFSGEALGDMLAAVLEKDPDWGALPAAVPNSVRALLARCLDKDPRTRLRDMGEARIALSRVAEDGPASATLPVRARPASRVAVAFAALGGAAVSLAAALSLWPEPEQRNPLDGPVPLRIALPGSEYDVAVSPGGDAILYCSDRDGVVDLWRYSLEGGEAVNLTRGRLPLMNELIRNLGFQGTVPWVHHSMTNGVFRLATAEATPEVLLAEDAVEPSWTRDRSRVVYHSHKSGDPIYVHGMDEPPGEPVVQLQEGLHQHYPVWSFDETWIYYVRGVPAIGAMHLWRMRPNGTRQEQLTTRQLNVNFPTPVDEDTVLFLGNDENGAGPWIWSLDVPTGRVRQAAIGLGHYTSLSASDDGRTLAATEANPKAALWQVPLRAPGDGLAREADAGLLPGVPSLRASSPRYASGQLFYLSSFGGGDGLFMVQDGKARELRAGSREPLPFPPAVSNDGESVAFVRRGGERMVLCILSVRTRQILREFDAPVDVRGTSSFSPDGTRIVIGGIGPDGAGLFVFSRDDGSWAQIARGAAFDPSWAPTEDLIVYSGNHDGPWVRVLAVTCQGEPVPLEIDESVTRRRESAPCRFTPDGRGLVFLGYQNVPFQQEFWHLDLGNGEVRQLTDLDLRGTIQGFDLSPDGTHLVFDRIVPDSDIVVWRLGGR
jgi:Tol biopolymer transport system component